MATRPALVAAAAAGAAAALYAPVAAGLAVQWYRDPDTAYGALVLAAAVVAARQRWGVVRSLPARGSASGAAALSLAALLYVAATLAADVFLLRVSAVAFAGAIVWFVFGSGHVRVLIPVFVLLVAAIPLPTALVTELTMPLQLAASRCAEVLLAAGGIDVARDGNVLILSYITLEVAEACSGMRSMVTLLALVAAYWGTTGAPTGRVLVLAAAAVPVAVLGNGLRVVATAVLAAWIGERAADGPVHEATGFVAFVVMCGVLVALLAVPLPRGRAEVRAA
jgi:exosortase